MRNSVPMLRLRPQRLASSPRRISAGFVAGWISGFVLSLMSASAFAQSPPSPHPCSASAHIFCVTDTSDDNTASGPSGSLRRAISDSNTAGGANTIDFDIAGTGPFTITLVAQLPAINANGNMTSLLIDGYSQAGSAVNTNAPDQGGLNGTLAIELVGAGIYGLFYSCCPFPKIDLTFQGLAMRGFYIPIAGQSATFTEKAKLNVFGNFIGTTLDGSAMPAQRNNYGIYVGYDDAQIGGAQAWQRNLISGNNGPGIIGGTPAGSIVVEGNLIGTDVTGTKSIPNFSAGVQPGGNFPGIRIGCTGSGCSTAASRNVISGNGQIGIYVADNYSQSTGGMQIKGNYVGTDWTGAQPLPNGNLANLNCPTYCGGIELEGDATKPAAVIGGFGPGEENTIAYNDGYGISGSAPGMSFDNQGNAVHNNARTDIAFDPTQGRIANDAGDADAGVNGKQNYPVIQSASVSGTPGNLTLNVTYLVDSATANSSYPLRVDFYVDVDEGSGRHLVSDSYPAASAQLARSVSLALPADVQSLAGFVTSATDANGYSSQFSPSHVFDRIFADWFE